MDPLEEFDRLKDESVRAMGANVELRRRTHEWMLKTAEHRYTYNFTWLGIPIIQFPQDIIALQEIIWIAKPNLIVETGIAHGGSLIFLASMLELLNGDGLVVGIDIDIREHNRAKIESHPMAKRITMIQGSSTVSDVADQVHALALNKERVLVILDSDHTHEHVRKEMDLYAPLVTKDSYLVVLDTSIEDAPEDLFSDRSWRKGNNPKTAVRDFLKTTDHFVIDKDIENRLLITVAPDGYLKRVKDQIVDHQV